MYIYIYTHMCIYNISCLFVYLSVPGLHCFEGHSLVELQGLLLVVAFLIVEYQL